MTYFPRQHYKRQGAKQSAICALCGNWVDVQDLILADVQGLRGFYVCSSHPWEKMARVNPSFQDRGGVGQVMDPGHDFLPAPGGFSFFGEGEEMFTSVAVTNVTNTTTTPVSTGLAISVGNNQTVAFRLVMFVAEATQGDGYRVDFDGGTASASSFRALGVMSQGNGSLVSSAGTAPPTTLAADSTFSSASSATDMLVFEGVMVTSSSGTFAPRIGKEADAAGGTLTMYAMSYLMAWSL